MQDEQHVLLECTCTGLVGVRNNYPELLKDCGGQWNTMNLLMRTEKSDDLAWCVHRCLRLLNKGMMLFCLGLILKTASSLKAEGHVIR